MNEELKSVLNIRYVKLHFELVFIEDTNLPMNKGSAIRGGIGEMLLRGNCIRGRDCDNCDFEEECLVQRTMYSKFKNKPVMVGQRESVGYVIECSDFREEFYEGDVLKFNLILFGKTIVYFNQYLQAIYALGQNGIGKNESKFYVSRVTNTRGKDILNEGNIFMEYYIVEDVASYVEYRKRKLMEQRENVLVFTTPLAIKSNGNMLKEFNTKSIMSAIKRRIYILACFEDIEAKIWYEKDVPVLSAISMKSKEVKVKRYSNRHNSAIYLSGVTGEVMCSEWSEELLELLLAGELIHIGSNTSFGFGKFIVK